MNKKIAIMYKKCNNQLIEVAEEVIADRHISMEDRIKFVTFINKMNATIDSKVKSESSINAETSVKEVVTNE